MSNTLTAELVTILAGGLSVLRKRVLLPRMVSRDTEPQVAMSRGKTVQIPIQERGTTAPVSASNTLLSPSNSSPTYATITLSEWHQSNFHLTDQEMTQIGDPNFENQKMVTAFDALAAKINGDLFSLYKDVGNFVGTAGTTPFASSQALMNNATAYLNKNFAPMDPRYGVLNFDAGGNAKNIAAIADLDTTGDASVKIDGRLGRRYGVDWFEEGQVPTHTAGTASTATVQASTAGVSTVSINGGADGSIFVDGDIITFAGHTQTYTVTSSATISSSSSGSVAIFPALAVSVSTGVAVTLAASHVSNLVFAPGAFGFASRPETEALALAKKMGVAIEMMVDPLTGITFTLEVQRQHKQFVWILSCLYGFTSVRPELACRIAG